MHYLYSGSIVEEFAKFFFNYCLISDQDYLIAVVFFDCLNGAFYFRMWRIVTPESIDGYSHTTP